MISMKKIIFAIILIFAIGLPFSLQAVQPIPEKKVTSYSLIFSKKQKKLNFFQRILLKKTERKLSRKIRKARRQQQNNSTDKKTRRVFLWGLGSASFAQVAISVAISIDKFVARIRYLIFFGGIAVILAVIAIVLALKLLRKKREVVLNEKSKWKIWLGIFLGIIGIVGTLAAISLAT